MDRSSIALFRLFCCILFFQVTVSCLMLMIIGPWITAVEKAYLQARSQTHAAYYRLKIDDMLGYQ